MCLGVRDKGEEKHELHRPPGRISKISSRWDKKVLGNFEGHHNNGWLKVRIPELYHAFFSGYKR